MKTVMFTLTLMLTACGADDAKDKDSASVDAHQASEEASGESAQKTGAPSETSKSDIFTKEKDAGSEPTMNKTEIEGCFDMSPNNVLVGVPYTLCDGSTAVGELDLVAYAKEVLGCPSETAEVEIPAFEEGVCVDLDPASVRQGLTIMMCDGSIKTGLLNVNQVYGNIISQGQKLCE